jgi:hypothetical protein
MEVLALLLLALLLPAIAVAAVICICAALFLTPIIFVDAAGGYSDVDAFFRTGSCALSFITSRTKGRQRTCGWRHSGRRARMAV